MSNAVFYIDGKKRTFSVEGTPEFRFGKDEMLSGKDTDIAYDQPWYKEGYTEEDFLGKDEFEALKNGLEVSIGKIISQQLSINTAGFNLEHYHHYVKTDADHFRIVSRTRDLFPEDFFFPIMDIVPRLEAILGFRLSDIDPEKNEKLHIIVRINRPGSKDYNPPHKDIYEAVDNQGYIPRFINFWIPVAGVTCNSSLPLAPASHRIYESAVLRTFDGGMVEGNKYRVRMIRSWNGDNALQRSSVRYGQVLIFSSHLIHGLAVNDEPDVTRVALEFRLFRKD